MFLIYRSQEFHQRPDTIALNAEEVRHVRARRMVPGEWVFIADGAGRGCPAVLSRQSAQRWYCSPDYERVEAQPPRERIVFASLPKGSRIDVIAEKGTELGMTRFVPVEFKRSVRDSFSTERLARLAAQAGTQCGRFRLPVFDEPIHFEELLARVTPPRATEEAIRFLMLDRSGDAPTFPAGNSFMPSVDCPSIAMVVGPEGGLTPEEFVSLKEAGALPVRISDGILRVETAVLAGLTLMQLLQGNPTF